MHALFALSRDVQLLSVCRFFADCFLVCSVCCANLVLIKFNHCVLIRPDSSSTIPPPGPSHPPVSVAESDYYCWVNPALGPPSASIPASAAGPLPSAAQRLVDQLAAEQEDLSRSAYAACRAQERHAAAAAAKRPLASARARPAPPPAGQPLITPLLVPLTEEQRRAQLVSSSSAVADSARPRPPRRVRNRDRGSRASKRARRGSPFSSSVAPAARRAPSSRRPCRFLDLEAACSDGSEDEEDDDVPMDTDDEDFIDDAADVPVVRFAQDCSPTRSDAEQESQ